MNFIQWTVWAILTSVVLAALIYMSFEMGKGDW